MLLNSFTFLFFFAAIVLLYYTIPGRLRWVLLLVASYYFYSTFDLRYVLILGVATMIAYLTGLAVIAGKRSGRARAFLSAGVVTQVAILGVFKYLNFFVESFQNVFSDYAWISQAIAMPRMELLLPVGLSFYTFSCISYVVDVYRGTAPVERHLGKLAVYIAFFPKLLAGPIERAAPFLTQLSGKIEFRSVQVVFGLQLLVWGLFKKVVIADRLAEYVDAAFTNPDFQSPVTLVIGVYFFAFQIYCDFSGYSDMAIGASAILGIKLMENFRRPYLSRSVPEFWGRRWHISLMAWFRDYVYIPLGGNKVSRIRWYGNLMVVFLISGLWHGANWTFIIWGALNGAYQVLYFMLAGLRERVSRLIADWLWNTLAILLTFHLILFSWIFFRAASVGDAWAVITRIFWNIPQLPMLFANYNWTAAIWVSLGLIVLLLLVEALDELRSLWRWLTERPLAVRWGFFYALFICLMVIGYWDSDDFVYMQF